MYSNDYDFSFLTVIVFVHSLCNTFTRRFTLNRKSNIQLQMCVGVNYIEKSCIAQTLTGPTDDLRHDVLSVACRVCWVSCLLGVGTADVIGIRTRTRRLLIRIEYGKLVGIVSLKWAVLLSDGVKKFRWKPIEPFRAHSENQMKNLWFSRETINCNIHFSTFFRFNVMCVLTTGFFLISAVSCSSSSKNDCHRGGPTLDRSFEITRCRTRFTVTCYSTAEHVTLLLSVSVNRELSPKISVRYGSPRFSDAGGRMPFRCESTVIQSLVKFISRVVIEFNFFFFKPFNVMESEYYRYPNIPDIRMYSSLFGFRRFDYPDYRIPVIRIYDATLKLEAVI